MGIDPKTVIRVVIGGQWYTCERGTFKIGTLQFVDDSGNRLGEPLGRSYEFWTTERDYYTGPLAEIQLYKLLLD